ncbi:methyltransferase domain-containing protein [Defluviimonas sp. WL0002]|uniref:Methyltransferase domain-containing protein n=1 Tax=Albidovulum marisflavi TaxID=2984159 RepID=A0ABT2Z9Z3_9RHOB|nr:methyltransferase domain-containing protein [Defluviimonas sp. WL0002]MCV2867965.1 methyltransferase domain-containing protein [Defluviimonas sp. WL0002]
MTGSSDWNPAAYARFADLRLRPALDLMHRVGDIRVQGDIVDLGCGSGSVGAALRHRFPGRRITGVDASPAMLAEAAKTEDYDELLAADIAGWEPAAAPALVFSNATLQWLGDHGALVSRLAESLAPGGVLAVQMPRQYGAPSHRFLREFAAEMFPDRFDFTGWKAPVSAPVEYHRMLAPLGSADVWETDYVQRLAPTDGGHPVRRFTESTAMRPFADKLSGTELAAFLARYEAALASAYPVESDGSVLFPFRRLFFVLQR